MRVKCLLAIVQNHETSTPMLADCQEYIISCCIDHSYVTKTSCCLQFLVVSCCFNILIPSKTILKAFDSKLCHAYPHFATLNNRLSNASFTWFASFVPYKSLWILYMVKWLWNSLFAIQITGSSMVTFGIRSRCTEGPCRFPVLPDEATGAGFYPTAS